MTTHDTAGTAREGMTMDTEHGEHRELARLIGDVRRAERERAEATARAERAEARMRELEALVMSRVAAITERDVLRAQQAPLVDAHDALVAAARAAGWTGAGATGAELVAWVRRGAMTTAAGIADDHGRTGVASAIRLAAMDLTGGE